MNEERARFVEDVALHWEAHGLPRIAGRIIGLLMVCDPPHRSATQLKDELGASKGSISTMTRLLLASGTLVVVAVPGDRATYYRLAPHSFEEKMKRRLEAMVGFRDLARRGVELLEAEGSPRVEELEQVASLYAFLGDELPRLFERWREG